MAPHRDARLPPRTRRILHLDVDAFLASVEVALHPALRGKPVVIGALPTARSVVMSCSYEARAAGVRPGMLLAEAQRRCPRAVFRPGSSREANAKREEVTRILLRTTPRVEVASIDDFFLDLSGTARLHGAAVDAAERIRAMVREETSLPLTIGIGASKLVARMAGKLAKPGGIGEILPGHEEAFLAPLPVDVLPGVGHATASHLERFAIRTIGELALVPREILYASFGHPGLVLYDRARGRDDEPVETTHVLEEDGRLVARPPRTIRREATFEPEEGRREVVAAMLAYLVERAAHRLRAAGLACGSVEVHVRWVDTRPRVDPGSRVEAGAEGLLAKRRRKLASPSDGTADLAAAARRLLDELPRRRALVKRTGVTLHALRPSPGWQGRLFDAPPADPHGLHPGGTLADRHRRLDDAVDRIRTRLGFGRVVRGSTLPLADTHPLGPEGYELRTPSLNQ